MQPTNVTIHRNGQNEGPFTIEQVNQMVRANPSILKDVAWHEGLTEWVPLSSIAGVKSETPPPPPPPASPQLSPSSSAKVEYRTYDEVPWFRRSGVNSVFVLLGIIIGPVLLFPIAMLFTGDIYFKKSNPNGTLKTWPTANKIVAVVILILWLLYIGNAFLGAFSGYSSLPQVDSPEVIELVEQILKDSPQGKIAGAIFGKMAIEMPAETKFDSKEQKRFARAMLKTENMGTVPIYYTVQWHNKDKGEIWVEILEQ